MCVCFLFVCLFLFCVYISLFIVDVLQSTDVFTKRAEMSTATGPPRHSAECGHPAAQQSNLAQSEMECEHTQDSFIDDSGFLPSTPPAKKASFNI